MRGRIDCLCVACQAVFEEFVGIVASDPQSLAEVRCPRCDSGGVKRLYSVPHHMQQSRYLPENADFLKWHTTEMTPSDSIIKQVHRFNYNEDIHPRDLEQVKRHKLSIW